MTRVQLVGLAFAASLLSACQGTSIQADEPPLVDNLYSNLVCDGVAEEDVRVLNNATEFRELAARIGADPSLADTINWKTRFVVFVAMGEKPTTGYTIETRSFSIEADRTTAKVFTHWGSPSPGAFTAQMMTSPCTLDSVERNGFTQVAIYRNGDERLGTYSLK